MATANLEDLPKAALIIGLFVIAMIGFASTMATNYGQNASIMKTNQIDYGRVERQVNSTSADANSWKTAFTSDNLFVALGGIVLFSIWGIIKLVLVSTLSFNIIFLDTITSVFGISPIVSIVIMAATILTVIFAAWRKVKLGY